MNNETKRLAFAFDLKQAPDLDGSFEGYASIFNEVDHGLDKVAPGAFRKSLGSGRMPKMLWQHDVAKVIGVWDSVIEDSKGLHVKGRLLNDVAQGKEALALLRAGAIDSMSIGYRTIAATKEGGGVRSLDEIELFEISLVTFPMLQSAQITDVKSIKTERGFEKFLRDAGYSKSEATAIALHGFKALTPRRDADAVDAEQADALKGLLNQLKQLQEAIK